MICVSIAEKNAAACLKSLKGLKMAEVRLESGNFSGEEIRKIFKRSLTLVATCRPGRLALSERRTRLITAIEAGAAYVDIELESEVGLRREIVKIARSHGCKVIISFHDQEQTPGRETLERIIDDCFKHGADVAKIACHVNRPEDAARLLGLLDTSHPLVVVGMGRQGQLVRLMAPMLGSLFTFASRRAGKETAPGQLPLGKMVRLNRFLKALLEG